MTTPKNLINSFDDAVSETLSGLSYTYPQLEHHVSHRVVLSPDHRDRRDKVALICGGGSGHEPFAAGFVGGGMLTASIAGSIFAAPPSIHITYALRCLAENSKAGILVIVPNYTGDCLNFGIAIEKTRQTGVTVEEVIVDDDCSIPENERSVAGKRGLVGMLFVIKIAGALAEKGLPLCQVAEIARHVSQSIATYGIGLSACAIPARRNAIIALVQVLMTAPCKPQNEDEVAIQTKFDKFIRSCSIKYSLLATCSCSGVTIRSFLNAVNGYLPYRVWLPYDFNTTPYVFWITSLQQIIAVILCTIINVGTETLVFGMFLQTCAQFEIFENRLHKLIINKTNKSMTNKITYLENSSPSSNKGKAIISKYVHHHLEIYKYARTVNAIFNQVLFVQFFGSVLVLCTSVYYLSTHSTLSETATLIIYTICMFVQIYVYCWSGNEVILKSVRVGDTIYNMNWPLLSVNDRKELLMIMLRSTLPMKFTSSFLITLSLQSYSNILKISYSAFNVLQK